MIRTAAVQMVSGTDWRANLERARELVFQAASEGAQWVVLPEYWPLMGARDTDKLAIAEPYGEGPLQAAMQDWARQCKITLFGGSIPLQSANPGKVRNSLIAYTPDGQCARYDKMHLFGFQGLGERYNEADTNDAGDTVPQWSMQPRVGVGICYDVRFPEFFRAQGQFDVLILPAAFTETTGRAHWALLLRARAVENQCWVVASAQGGLHQNGRRTFGHSMIIDPWGEVVAVLPEGEGVVHATLDFEHSRRIRSKLPALSHQRITAFRQPKDHD